MRPDEDDDDLADAVEVWDDVDEDQQAEFMRRWTPQPDPEVIMDYNIVLVPKGYDRHYISHEWRDKFGDLDRVQIEANAVGTVGNILVLHQKYDAEQIWFPFVQAILTQTPPTKEQRIRQILDERRMREVHGWRSERERSLRDRANQPIHVSDDDEKMYHYPRGRWGFCEESKKQYLLPFKEFQEVTDAQMLKVFRETWDRMDGADEEDETQYLTLAISGSVDAIRNWLRANIFGRFYYFGGAWTFERYEDWMHAKLKFQGAPTFHGDDA